MATSHGDGGGMTLAVRNLPLKHDTQSMKIIALGRVLDEFRFLNPNMPVAQIQAFLMVALDTGPSMSDISTATGTKNSTTSRHLLELGPSRLDDDGAFGLVERRVDPQDERRARYLLTRKGKRLVAAVVSILSGDVK